MKIESPNLLRSKHSEALSIMEKTKDAPFERAGRRVKLKVGKALREAYTLITQDATGISISDHRWCRPN